MGSSLASSVLKADDVGTTGAVEGVQPVRNHVGSLSGCHIDALGAMAARTSSELDRRLQSVGSR